MSRHLADLAGGDVQTPRCQLSRELFGLAFGESTRARRISMTSVAEHPSGKVCCGAGSWLRSCWRC